MKLSVGTVTCLLLWVLDIVQGSADNGAHHHGETPALPPGTASAPDSYSHTGHHNEHNKGGSYGKTSKECTTSICTDIIQIPSHMFDSSIFEHEVTKAVAKHILSQTTVIDVSTIETPIPVCECREKLVEITKSFEKFEIPMLIEGCSPISREVTFTTLTTKPGSFDVINDCTSASHELTLPRLSSTVLHSHAKSFIFDVDLVTKTKMIPVASATRFNVCTATCEEEHGGGGYGNHGNQYGPPPVPYGSY